MRILLASVLIITTFLTCFAQNGDTKPLYLQHNKLKKRVVKKVIPTTPENFRTVDAKGTIYIHINVDRNGNVEKAQMISGFEPVRKYVEDSALKWKFKPLKIKNEATTFRSVLILYLCYGGFISDKPMNC